MTKLNENPEEMEALKGDLRGNLTAILNLTFAALSEAPYAGVVGQHDAMHYIGVRLNVCQELIAQMIVEQPDVRELISEDHLQNCGNNEFKRAISSLVDSAMKSYLGRF